MKRGDDMDEAAGALVARRLLLGTMLAHVKEHMKPSEGPAIHDALGRVVWSNDVDRIGTVTP